MEKRGRMYETAKRPSERQDDGLFRKSTLLLAATADNTIAET